MNPTDQRAYSIEGCLSVFHAYSFEETCKRTVRDLRLGEEKRKRNVKANHTEPVTALLPALVALIPPAFQPSVPIVEVHLAKGHFSPGKVHIPEKGRLKLINDDKVPYTVEGAGALPGDVIVPPHQERTVDLLPHPGRFHAIIEENPDAELVLEMAGDPEAASRNRPLPFDAARRLGRQPVLFEPGQDPAYATYTTFDLVGHGEEAQQAVLRDLYLIQESLAHEEPPEDFRLFFTPADWRKFRQSASMIYALGPGAYASRFGPRISTARPADLAPLPYSTSLGLKNPGQRDILVRVSSDRQWFNQQVVRWIWRKLQGRISKPTMETGYANPNGRSPILGGFFDGTGNPYAQEREAAVFGDPAGNGTYLALFRIVFDEERFRAHSLQEQQRLIGRDREIGKPLKEAKPAAHMNRAGADPHTAILRQPFVFDDGPEDTGLLFASLQATPRALDRLLHGFMLGSPRPAQKRPQDLLLNYMHFKSATLYYLPASPKGSYPGSIRFGGK